MKIICDLVDKEIYIEVLINEQDCMRVLTGELLVYKHKKMLGKDCFVSLRYGVEEDAS